MMPATPAVTAMAAVEAVAKCGRRRVRRGHLGGWVPDGGVYVQGSDGDDRKLDDTWRFDVARRAWTRHHGLIDNLFIESPCPPHAHPFEHGAALFQAGDLGDGWVAMPRKRQRRGGGAASGRMRPESRTSAIRASDPGGVVVWFTGSVRPSRSADRHTATTVSGS